MERAFLFAGQGAQTVGMAGELLDNSEVKQLFDSAEREREGIVSLMLTGPAEELNKTINTQPCMYLADLAYAIVAREKGEAEAVCGFSVGEVAALAYAGVFSYLDGFKIILERARLMQEACEANEGAMVAVIGLESKVVDQIAASVKSAWAVNYNTPAQTVVACAKSSVDSLLAAVAKEKGRAIKLAVSGAFHSPFMTEAAEKLRTFLQGIQFHQPKMPVYANLTAMPYYGKADKMRDTLAKQVCNPVLFCDTILNMGYNGMINYVECGPGKVLTGLVRKI